MCLFRLESALKYIAERNKIVFYCFVNLSQYCVTMDKSGLMENLNFGVSFAVCMQLPLHWSSPHLLQSLQLPAHWSNP